MAETNPSSILATAQSIFGDGFSVQNFHGGQHVDEQRLREYYKTGGAHSTTGVFVDHQINRASFFWRSGGVRLTVYLFCARCLSDSVRDPRDRAGGAEQRDGVACGLRRPDQGDHRHGDP